MQADPLSEDLLPLADALDLIPGRPHRLTVHRWIKSGVVAGGGRVKLGAVKVGGKWFVSRKAIGRFVAATTAGAVGGAAGDDRNPPPESARRAGSRPSGSAERLRAMGWL